jgi:probable phosphoglycerate mutase
MGEIWLIRHGQTAWTLTKQHTGRRDIPMTDLGKRHAIEVGKFLNGKKFEKVLVSPLSRALETCRLAGYAETAEIVMDVAEWDYGKYEGLTPQEIRKQNPHWTIWTRGVPDGETLKDVTSRAERTIESISQIEGDVAIFSHGHFLRIFASCWLGLSSETARFLMLDTASLGILGIENGVRVLKQWNIHIGNHFPPAKPNSK